MKDRADAWLHDLFSLCFIGLPMILCHVIRKQKIKKSTTRAHASLFASVITKSSKSKRTHDTLVRRCRLCALAFVCAS